MQAWLAHDERGRSYLVRAGSGVVTAVVPVGEPTAEGTHTWYRVELSVDRPPGRPRSIRLTTHGQVLAGDPLLEQAAMAELDAGHVVWQIEWHRHDWIPGDLDITSLDLSTDTVPRLVALDRAGLEVEIEAAHGGQEQP